ncbi:MAG: hypothetical protein QXM75_01690 [Candidatus Diapherotrites archaeon]
MQLFLKKSQRAFFTSVFILLIVSALLGLLASYAKEWEILNNAHAIAIEMESMGFIRYQIEENINKVIKETIEEELSNKNTDSFSLNKTVNKKIIALLEYFKKGFGCEVYVSDGTKKLPVSNLNDLSRTLVIEAEGVIIAEYTYTGGAMKDKKLVCELKGNKVKAFVFVLPGYTVKVVKVV